MPRAVVANEDYWCRRVLGLTKVSGFECAPFDYSGGIALDAIPVRKHLWN